MEIFNKTKTINIIQQGVIEQGVSFVCLVAILKKSQTGSRDYCINGGKYNEDGVWQPSKDGLGIGHVLDFIGVNYK